MIRKIITYPDPFLQQIAKHVEIVDDDVRGLLSDMVETMYAGNGVGLAAPQIAVGLRVIVIDVSPGMEGGGPGLLKIVNPEIISEEGEIEWEEGCLSVPDFTIKIKRSGKITARYLDENGKQQEIIAEGLLAVAMQHEIDHLDGKLIIEHASRIRQDLYLRKVRKKQKGKISF